MRAKVLTVSDGVVAGTREDESGRALADQLAANGFEVVSRGVVSDGIDEVASTIATANSNLPTAPGSRHATSRRRGPGGCSSARLRA